MKFHGILVIFRFWGSHGAGPSIWPRKNKRFVKGRGFVKNADYLISHAISWNFMIFHKIMKFPEISWIPQISTKTVPLRWHVKTAVIQSIFNGSGAEFLPRTSQNQIFGVSCWILLKSLEFHRIPWNLWWFNGIQWFPTPAAPQECKHQ